MKTEDLKNIISNSKIPTECIIEGIAASMGSIIWATGDVSLMRDYAIPNRSTLPAGSN